MSGCKYGNGLDNLHMSGRLDVNFVQRILDQRELCPSRSRLPNYWCLSAHKSLKNLSARKKRDFMVYLM